MAQRVAGLFSYSPFPNFRVSPIGVELRKFCCIQHLSFPYGAAINDGIPVEDPSVIYSRNDDAIALPIWRPGAGSSLGITDIKSAFRIIPIRPGNYSLLGIYWRGNYYFAQCNTLIWV